MRTQLLSVGIFMVVVLGFARIFHSLVVYTNSGWLSDNGYDTVSEMCIHHWRCCVVNAAVDSNIKNECLPVSKSNDDCV